MPIYPYASPFAIRNPSAPKLLLKRALWVVAFVLAVAVAAILGPA